MDIIYSRKRIRMPKFNNKKTLKSMQIIIILIIAIFVMINSINAIIPIFEKQCENQAKSIITIVSNNKATEVMKDYEYEDLFTMHKDENGNITMLSSNVIPINKIISDIPVRIQEELNKQNNTEFNISLGSTLGSRFFSGRGPKIKVKILNVGNLDTDLKSEFVSMGINQTKHRMYLNVKCNMQAMTPYKVLESTIYNQVLLLENIIVGITPDTYYNLEGVTQDDIMEVI